MSRYFRAVIDFVVLDDGEEFANALSKEAKDGDGLSDPAYQLQRNIEAGVVEIDGVSDIEVHG